MAARANIIIDQGTDFDVTLTVTDDFGDIQDLEGFTAEGQIRKHYSSETLIATFETEFGVPRSSGLLTIKLPRSITTNIEAGRYVYDVEITSQFDVRSRLIEGTVTVTPEVTR